MTRDAFIERVTDSAQVGETWRAQSDDGTLLGTVAVNSHSDPGLWSEEELKTAFVVHCMITDRPATGRGVGAHDCSIMQNVSPEKLAVRCLSWMRGAQTEAYTLTTSRKDSVTTRVSNVVHLRCGAA